MPEYKVFKIAASGSTINSRGTGYLNTDRDFSLVRKCVRWMNEVFKIS
jgi:hypothetical protein